uniref:VWFA domain-containing protein n=1 Tax=Angiostrongylus cantonensis TaxID=6313 RepID=A0A0K0D1T3_ANGCA
LDLGFILDTSGSIEEIYNEHVRWTVALVETLPISREAVRVSTIHDVVKHLQEMSFQSGVTRTGFALRRAEDEIFNVNRGARYFSMQRFPSLFSSTSSSVAIKSSWSSNWRSFCGLCECFFQPLQFRPLLLLFSFQNVLLYLVCIVSQVLTLVRRCLQLVGFHAGVSAREF